MDFDENNNLWFGTAPQGIFKQSGDTFVNYNFFNSNIASGEVMKVLVKNSHSVFLLTNVSPAVGGLYTMSFFDGHTFSVIIKQEDTRGIYSSFVFAHKDENTEAIVGQNKIYEYSNGIFKQFGSDSLYDFQPFFAFDMMYDAQTGYWIADYSGLHNYRLKGSKTYTTKNSGLPGNKIVSIAKGKNDNIFVAIERQGIAIYQMPKLD